VDGAPAMLRLARELEAASPESARVTLLQGLVPNLVLPRAAYDAVVSNSLLHHLQEPAALWMTIRRYAAPGAPVVIMDLVRPTSPAAAQALVDTYAGSEAEILRRDFLASLYAAFEPGEIEAQLQASGLGVLMPRLVSDRHVLVAGHMP